MQLQASGMNTLFNFGSSLPSVSVSTGGLSCGSPLTDFCRPRVSRLARGAGAGLVSFWGTPRRFSWLWCAPELKRSVQVLRIGPRVLFRRLQTIGFVVQPKASRLAPASALASFNAKARHRGSQPVVQQAALAERRAQCTHNPSVEATRHGGPPLRASAAWVAPCRSPHLKR